MGCKTSLEECICDKIEIYGYPSNILTPIRVTPESMLEMEPYILKDSKKIKQLITELKNLKRTNYNGEVDNRFLLKLHCNRNTNIMVESNSYITKINVDNFEPTESFINLVENFVN